MADELTEAAGKLLEAVYGLILNPTDIWAAQEVENAAHHLHQAAVENPKTR